MDFLGDTTPFVEIFVIAVIINYVLFFFWNSRSLDLMLGTLAFLLILAATSMLDLPILRTITTHIVNVITTAVIVIFSPELRMALSKLSLKGKKYKSVTEFDKFLDQLTLAVYILSKKKIGALIVLENEDNLQDLAQKGIPLNAAFSPELLESIFNTTTPLHDGAVIIRDKTILAAGVILPLAEDLSYTLKLIGTRHRAAIGTSETTDALVLVVSEETGKVSFVRAGSIARGVQADRFKGLVRSFFNPASESQSKKKLSFKEWLMS